MLINGKQILDASITPDKLTGDFFATPTQLDKNLVASVTTADGDLATSSTVSTTPVGGSNIAVDINGAGQLVARLAADKATSDCYFSDDLGVTAKDLDDVVAGDELYWNGTIAGFELAATDRIDFIYDI